MVQVYWSLECALICLFFLNRKITANVWKCFSRAGALCMYTLTEFLPRLWVVCYPIPQTWKLRNSYLSEIKQLMSKTDVEPRWPLSPPQSCLLWTVTQQEKRSWREEKCYQQSEACGEGTETLFWALNLNLIFVNHRAKRWSVLQGSAAFPRRGWHRAGSVWVSFYLIFKNMFFKLIFTKRERERGRLKHW